MRIQYIFCLFFFGLCKVQHIFTCILFLCFYIIQSIICLSRCHILSLKLIDTTNFSLKILKDYKHHPKHRWNTFCTFFYIATASPLAGGASLTGAKHHSENQEKPKAGVAWNPPKPQTDGGFHSHEGTPIAGWFTMENPWKSYFSMDDKCGATILRNKQMTWCLRTPWPGCHHEFVGQKTWS